MEVFEAVFPIVAISVFGYVMTRREVISEAESLSLEKFTFAFLVPCLLFLGTATARLPEIMDWYFMLAFYLAVFLVYLLGMLISRLLYGYQALGQSVFGMAGAYSNVTVLGVPICLELLGQEAFVPMFIIIAVHNMLIFAFGTLLAERREQSGSSLLKHVGRVMKDMLRNPISGSLLAGGLINILGIPVYQPLLEVLSLFSRAAVPAALFAVGAALTRYRIRGEVVPALIMVCLKLVILPLLMWFLMFRIFNIDSLWATTAVLLSSMPVGISVYVFSKRYRSCETQVAAALVFSSLLAVPVVSVIAYLLHR
ncbi:MAG: AEC family transporter [Pseudomonadales bacterium]|nr:AEC family transporter [Pseudomonadales bacterium]